MKATPEQLCEFCERHLVKIEVREGVLTLTKNFTPNNASEYAIAESIAFQAIQFAPVTRNGSTWGTTSDGVGGYSALIHGQMKLNKSGVSVRWLNKLHKLIEVK